MGIRGDFVGKKKQIFDQKYNFLWWGKVRNFGEETKTFDINTIMYNEEQRSFQQGKTTILDRVSGV